MEREDSQNAMNETDAGIEVISDMHTGNRS